MPKDSMDGKSMYEFDRDFDNPHEAIAHDGGIIGNPGGYRFATGGRKPNVKDVGPEMLRNRHRGGKVVE